MQINIRVRIILGFFLISLTIPAVGFFSWYFLHELATPIQKDIPDSAKTLSVQTKLEGIAQLIRYYDETLTQSARNYAFTQNKKWKDRYFQDALNLDTAIKDAIALGDERDKSYFQSVDSANIALVKMEEQAMGFVDIGNKAEAIRILDSQEYWNQKDIYKKGIFDYVSYRSEQFGKAISESSNLLLSSGQKAENILGYALGATVLVAILGSIISIILGVLISYSVEGDLEKYKLFYKFSKDAIMTLSPPDWRFSSGNPEAIKLFGAKDEKEFISFGPSDVSPEKQPDGLLSSEKARKMIDEALVKGSNFFDWVHKKYKRDNFFATVLLTRIEINKKVFLLATVRDVTKEKQSQLQMEKLNSFMIGRELKMAELKKKITDLESKNINI